MKKLLILCSLVLLPLLASAQQAVDVVYLNNGNILKGEITTSNDTAITLRAQNGETYTFDRVAIRRIDHGEQLAVVPEVPKSHYVDHSERVQGFWAAADLLGGLTVDHDSSLHLAYPVEMQFTFGYRFSEFLQIGVGAGFRYYIDGDRSRCYHGHHDQPSEDYGWAFPIYGQLRGLFYSGQSRTTVPFWQFSVGHTVNDGFMLSPALGLRFGSAERHHFTLGLNYTAQWSWLDVNAVGGHMHRFGTLHILQLRLGYQF